MIKILVVDDEELTRFTVCEILQQGGHETIDVCCGAEALGILDSEHIDLIVTDMVMPEMNGNVFIDKAREMLPDIPIIVISGGGRTMTYDYLEIAKQQGTQAILNKPFSPETLLLKVDEALA